MFTHPKVMLLNEIRNFYRSHELPYSRQVREALTRAQAAMNAEGAQVSLMLYGSVAMGMATPDFDVDLSFGYLGSWSRLKQSPEDTPQNIVERLYNNELPNGPHINFFKRLPNVLQIRWVMGKRPEEIDESDLFLFSNFFADYQTFEDLGEHVAPVIEEIHALSQQREDLASKIGEKLESDGFPCESNGWHDSFAKYHERLGARGISIPNEQLAREQAFLSSLFYFSEYD